MRFEREKDIPELHGKTRKERQVLREQARQRDTTIRRLELLGIILSMFFMPVADWIAERIRSHSVLAWFGIYVVLATPFILVFRGVFIISKIRRALTSDGNAKI